MKKTDSFTHPLPGFGGQYNTQSWAGYQHLQVRTPEDRSDLRHIGDDYNGPGGGDSDLGMRIEAVAPGIVEKVIKWNGNYGFGNHVFIRHELTKELQAAIKNYCGVDSPILYSHYAHCNEILVPEGMEVDKGQLIAYVGKTGTTYAHCHCDIRKPTGRGYEDYPSLIKGNEWVTNYYIAPFPLIESFKTIDQYMPKPTPPAPVPPQKTALDFILIAEQAISEAKKLLPK